MRNRDTSYNMYSILHYRGWWWPGDTHLTAADSSTPPTIDICPWLHVVSRSCLLSAATLITGINNQICRAVITIYCVVACVRSGAIVISIVGPDRSEWRHREVQCHYEIGSASIKYVPPWLRCCCGCCCCCCSCGQQTAPALARGTSGVSPDHRGHTGHRTVPPWFPSSPPRHFLPDYTAAAVWCPHHPTFTTRVSAIQSTFNPVQ